MWDRAIDAFRRVVALEPSNLRARYFLATTYMDGGRDAEREAELERILRADPRSIDARVQLGFPARPRPSATTRPSRRSARPSTSSPSGPSCSSISARRYYRAKQYDRAADDAEGRPERSTTSSKDLHFQLGVVYEKQAKFDDAVGTFRRVIVARSQARRGLQLRRLHVRRARPEPRRGGPAHQQGPRRSSPTTATSSTASAGRTTSRGGIPEALQRAQARGGEGQGAGSRHLRAPRRRATSRTVSTRTPLAAWEKALQLDPAADGVKKKVDDLQGPSAAGSRVSARRPLSSLSARRARWRSSPRARPLSPGSRSARTRAAPSRSWPAAGERVHRPPRPRRHLREAGQRATCACAESSSRRRPRSIRFEVLSPFGPPLRVVTVHEGRARRRTTR